MKKAGINDFKPKILWLSGVFWFFLIAEIFCIGFVVYYWKELQSSVEISRNDAILQAVFGNSIVLGFIRSMIIFLAPLICYLVLALSTRIMYAKNIHIPGLDIEAVTEGLEGLNETEIDYEKMKENFDKEKAEMRQILEQVIDTVKQKRSVKK